MTQALDLSPLKKALASLLVAIERTERGMIADPLAWFEYRQKRNLTTHTYDEAVAQDVYRAAVDFASDAQALLAVLLERNKP